MAKRIAGITIELDADTSALVKGLDKAAKQVDKIGQSIEKVGQGFTKNLTAPIIAVGGASVAAFNEVDEGLDTIVQKTGATGDAADAMGESMKNLATSIPTDFKTAGEAIGEVNTRFGVTGDELETLSGQFIKFSQLNNTDVSDSIDTVQKALSAYGLGAESATDYLDRLNKVGQDTGVSVDSLSAGIVSNATAFKEMGLGIDEAVTFMGQLEKSGANSETVLNGMRKALKNATDQGIPLDQALSDLQNTILNGTSSIDGLSAAYDIFGKSGDQIYGAVKDGTINFQDLATAMSDAGNSVSATFENTLDPTDDFTTTMNELKVTGSEVGQTLLTMLIPVIEKVGEIIKDVKTAWEGLSPDTQEAIIQAAAIVAAIGPIIVIVGKLVSGIGSIISIASGLIAVISAISAPVLIVIGVITALIAIGVLLYKNWDEICAWAKKLKDTIVQAWDNIKSNTKEKWDNMKSNISNAMSNAKQSAIDKANEIKTNISNKWNDLKSNTSSKWDDIKGTMSSKLGDAYDKVRGIIDRIKGLFNFSWSLPDIRLPHFSVSGGFSLNPPQVPHISVQWYKKAMSDAYMLNGATIFGAKGGSLLGGGESGSEMIIGTNKLLSMIAQAKGGETVITNTFNINGTDKDPQTLAQEISFYLDMELQRTERTFA